MKLINSYVSASGSTHLIDVIFEDNPHIKSMANLIMLNDYYKEQDVDYIQQNNDLRYYLSLRHKFMKQIISKEGGLTCHYCGKHNLEIGYEEIEKSYLNNKNPKLATIDHKIPRSSGYNPLDMKNWVVSCKKCNKLKGSSDYEEFIKKIKK